MTKTDGGCGGRSSTAGTAVAVDTTAGEGMGEGGGEFDEVCSDKTGSVCTSEDTAGSAGTKVSETEEAASSVAAVAAAILA